jgi:sensor histidine kinase YesM
LDEARAARLRIEVAIDDALVVDVDRMLLAMLNVRKMVEGVHGGSVEITSAPGEGTRVTVVLPRRQGE